MATAVEAAQAHLAAGRPGEALAALQQAVRERPDEVRLRIFLFQLLAVLEQWPRAATQLELCGELDAATLAMVVTYREALRCEALRTSVFAGERTPVILGPPRAWVAPFVQALVAHGKGDAAAAAHWRAQGLEAAPACAGTLNGTPFAWIADADSRLGPMLEVIVQGRYGWLPFEAVRRVEVEPPTDLRDIVWAPAQFEFADGGSAVGLIPTRYAAAPGSTVASLSAGASAEASPIGLDAERLARNTSWLALADGQFAGRGQRLLITDEAEVGLLEVRQIEVTAR